MRSNDASYRCSRLLGRGLGMGPAAGHLAVIGITALLLAVLHGLEASLWAVSYVWLGASPDFTNAVFFSLQMITTLGADIVSIEVRWKLMGPLEAMSGMLLFGLSTAFLPAVLQRAWPAFAQERTR
jgi:hypothetical protein